MDRFVNKVFNGDARRLLRALPTACIDAVITTAPPRTTVTIGALIRRTAILRNIGDTTNRSMANAFGY